MMAEEKLKAVQFWNVVSERLQEIVNNSAADINALALSALKEKENLEKQSQTSILTGEEVCQHFINTGSTYDASAYSAHQYNGQVNSTQQFLNNHNHSILSLPTTSPVLPKESSDSLNHSLQQSLAATTVRNSKAHDLDSLSALTDSETPLHEIVPASINSKIENINIQQENDVGLEQIKLSNMYKKCKTLPKKNKVKPNRLNKILSKKLTNENQKTSSSDKTTDISVKKEIEESEENFSLRTPCLRALLERKIPENVVWKQKKDKSSGSGIENINNDVDHGNVEISDESHQDETTTEIVVIHADDIGDNKNKVVCSHEKADGALACQWCQKRFPNNSQDQRWDHTKPYTCTECDAQFSTRHNLIVHQRRHTGEKPYSCSQCEARFSTQGNLKRHVKTHSGEKPWQCMQCGNRFTEKKSLKVHMRRHTGEKPYQCQVCGKRFAQTGILQTHMAMHLDQKAHLCEHCGKSFRQKSQLRLHMLRHEGVRKYACAFCPARFLTKGDLERHNRIHTGERPFVCEICGKSFTRQQSLNEHTNRHYGLKPYECKYCMKGFAEMSACYKHIKHHERLQNTNCGVDQSQQCENELAVPHPNIVNLPVESETPNLQLPTSDALNHIVEVNQADYREIEKFTVLVHTGEQSLEVASEMTVEQREHQDHPTTIAPNTGVQIAVAEQMSDFTAINLLASASTFQQNY
ncbi:uncharacterized protein [Centruroides vittatus]